MRYEVRHVATVKVYRVITVEAWNKADAKKRAFDVARNPARLHSCEDVGDWCDSTSPSAPRTVDVTKIG